MNMFMMHSFPSLSWEPMLPVMIDASVQSLFVLVGAALCVAMLKRGGASSSTCCHVWTVTTVCLVALPLASRVIPAWNGPLSAFLPNTAKRIVSFPSPNPGPGYGAVISNATHPQTASKASMETTLLQAEVMNALRTEVTNEAVKIEPHWLFVWLPSVWLAGFVAVLSATMLGWISLLRLYLTTEKTSNPRSCKELQELSSDLGIRRPIRLVESHRRAIPMTWGLCRPTIHLPSSSIHWTAGDRRAVLLHELAHVRRNDYVTQLMARFACAVYWYNPLAWYAMRSLRAEQEAACDDVVLNHGTNPAGYAQLLTQVVTGAGQHSWEAAAALAAGRAGQLEQRIAAILSTNRNRRAPSKRQTTVRSAGILAAAFVIVSAGPLRISVAQRSTDEVPHGASETQNAPENDLAGVREILLKNYVRDVDSKEITRRAIEGMLASLEDPYSKYISPDDLAVMKISIQGELSGIGARLDIEGGQPIIAMPLPGSPARESGLKSGDVILEIDARSTASLTLPEVADQIRGPIGSVVTLKIRRDGDTVEVKVTRDRIKLQSVHGLRAAGGSLDSQNPFMIDSGSGIGYAHVSQLSDDTADELREVLVRLSRQGLKGAILDLRFCPGGSLKPAVEVADLFLPEGNIVIIRGRDGNETVMKASGKSYVGDFPLVVIVNEHTASAAEIIAGALQDHDRAKIVGTRTFGKASVQSLVAVSEELGAIKLTTAFYCPPNGRNIDRMPGNDSWGIDADDGYFVPLTEEQYEQLRARFQAPAVSNQSQEQADAVTPDTLRHSLGDLQLAAALETLQRKLRTGAFVRIGKSRVALEDYLKRSNTERRQAEILERLDQLESIVRDLNSDG